MKRFSGPSLPMALAAACLVGCFSLAVYLQPSIHSVWADDEAPAAEAATEEAAPAEGAEEEDPNPPTSVKMEEAEWPGLVTIFADGGNWREDKGYVTAIAECGFGSAVCFEWQIDIVSEAGMKAYVLLETHECATVPQKHVDNYNVLCYCYSTEVLPPDQWGAWAECERQSYNGDPRHPAMRSMLARLGAIDQYCNIVRARAMEYYHYHWDGNERPEHYYYYLDQYRLASLANNHVPICRAVEMCVDDPLKTRQTVFTSLAYGTRGFKTGGVGLFDFNNRDDRDVLALSIHGEEALRFNTALAHYSPIFEKARSVDVYQTAPLPTAGKEAPEGYWVRPSGAEIVLGEFNDPANKADETRWLVVANRDAFNPHEATIHFTSGDVSVRLMDKQSGEWQDLELTADGDGKSCVVPLIEGDGELLEVTGGNWPTQAAAE